jgi:hypothetical protein
MMTCVDARHLSDDSRQRTPRWSLTPVRQASLINLPGRGSPRSGIFRRQNRVVASIPADADPAVRFILKVARGVLASRQLEVNANLGQDTIRTRLYRGHRWGPHIGMVQRALNVLGYDLAIVPEFDEVRRQPCGDLAANPGEQPPVGAPEQADLPDSVGSAQQRRGRPSPFVSSCPTTSSTSTKMSSRTTLLSSTEIRAGRCRCRRAS